MGRANFRSVLSIWFVVLANSGLIGAERWSRQVSSSDWIPLADPRNQQGQNLAPPPHSQVHQPLIPGSLPPELRQEYQQQLLQLQKTQESIQRLLLLQQQLKAQQQLLQGQGFLPSGGSESDENKQGLLPSGLANTQTLPDLNQEVLIPPQLSSQPKPPLYNSQNFHAPQGGTIRQEQYEDYSDHQIPDYKNEERAQEELREENKYVPEAPSGPGNDGESSDDGEEEIQVVYVPAETLAQRGQSKLQQRDRDRKQFGNHDSRNHQRRPQGNQHGSLENASRQRDNAPTTVSPENDAYARDFLQQLQREHEGTDRLLKEAREKEFERLREERREIQRRAKLQQAAIEREQEIQRQREAERNQKELAKLEEAAKQRELERLRGSRERQRLEEIERAKKDQAARANEEKRKQDAARQAEIERLAELERQKNAEIESTIAAQKNLERIQKEHEERAREAEKSQLARQKETSKIRHGVAETSPQAEPLIRNEQTHQKQHAQSGKYNRPGRNRNKQRQRQHNQNREQEKHVDEATTTAPPSPNQPPLAVYMSNLVGDTRNVKVIDVLKTLKGAQSIDVLDSVDQNAPHVFVGPSNLQVPGTYAKFDLPYLSSIDNNRVERRVDKLPFFVAPLSFNPPAGYSKIPFPAPHIGSVVINNLDLNSPITQPDENLEQVQGPNLNPLIEPNSFRDDSSHDASYLTTYDSSTPPTYTNLRHEEPSSTPVYQSSSSYSTNGETSEPASNHRFRQPFDTQSPSGPGVEEQAKQTYYDQSRLRPSYQDESRLPLVHNVAAQYNDDNTRPTPLVHRQPNVVTSFDYQESPQPMPSSTPIYENSYSNIRDDSSNRPTNSELGSSDHDTSQHRQPVNRYPLPNQRKNQRGQDYSSGHADPELTHYEDHPSGPAQYNLPAELPPIHPQLPGLVNSLLEENGQAAVANRQPSLPTTTTPTTTKTYTTTHAPTTNQRSRSRHRGRVVATRPTTTTTSTTSSPTSRNRDPDRTRRPFGRTRSRFTTTTEEYRESYDPTKAKTTVTTPRYVSQDNYRRPVSTKYKSRGSEEKHGSKNQVHGTSAQKTANARYPSLDPNSRQTDNTEVDSNEPVFTQYDYASATTTRENYPILDSNDRQNPNTGSESDYSKNLNHQQIKPAALDSSKNQQDHSMSQQFQERYPTSEFGQSNIEETPINGFNYQIRNEPATATQIIPPASRDYAYYQNKQESFENSHIPTVTSGKPLRSQNNEYQHAALYENSDSGRPESQFPTNEENTSGFGATADGLYNPYSRDEQNGLRATGSFPKQSPIEFVTEAEATTTTTETVPVVIRQRVRARLGGRGRPDSPIQTKPRGSQEEYVRFSAVNNQNAPTTERSNHRQRESQRTKPKILQHSSGVQVQTEGNDYVRIQAPVRTYQKTIVTPPSTTQRTTTVRTPVTTPVEYETNNDELEYGFIRPPNFAPVHPTENKYQHSYKIGHNQAQLQSILPTDETAADSTPNHTQVSRNRPKYQSPNRHPTDRSVSSTTLTSDTSANTERSRTRVEEPRNNRIRARGRKPGRRRTTTTTTTTTEYIVEENNDLPLEENYPRPIKNFEDLGNDRSDLYNDKFVALPLATETLSEPSHQQQRENSFSSQDLLLNFGPDSDQLPNLEFDQTQLASQSTRKYSESGGTRSGTALTDQDNQDRDIYGSESQWSTKLTSASFQPSPNANRLVHDDRRPHSSNTRDKSRYSNEEASAEVPEIITAPPLSEESYVTVMVKSDLLSGKSATVKPEVSSEAPSMEGTNYGMKMGAEGPQILTGNTTSTSVSQTSSATNSTDGAGNSESGKSDKSIRENQTMKRVGGRRRRVRVRVRPAPSDDFVTAESQHFNSAMNNLLRDRLKFHGREGEPRDMTTSTQSSILNKDDNAETPETNVFQDLLKEVFKTADNGSSADNEFGTLFESEVASSPTTDRSEPMFDSSRAVQNQSEVSNESTRTSKAPEATSDRSETVTIHDEVIATTTDRSEFSTTPENFTDDGPRTDKSSYSSEGKSEDANDSNANEISTETPLMTTMTIPLKSWDSTKSSSAVTNGADDFSYTKQNIENALFDDNKTGQDNEVLENNYPEGTSKYGDDTSSQNEDTENYPKNHRSEWSEVHYPTNPDLYNHSRRWNATPVQLSGIVTKSQGDTSVKTLSDYVQAIFDTMKNAEEEKSSNETTLPTADNASLDGEGASTTLNASGDVENVPTTISSSFDRSTGISEASEYISDKLASASTDSPQKIEAETRVDAENAEARKNEEFTDLPESTETSETTRYTEGTTEIPTEINSIDSTSLPLNSKILSSPTGVESANTIEPKISLVATTPTENPAKNSTRTKLGTILRTLTTTKVSHMTEICYRGKCVMTKPKKEINAR